MSGLKSRFMEWRYEKIWIVELPSGIHADAVYRFAVMMAVATGNAMGRYLRGHQAAYANEPPVGVAEERKWEPDCSVGPSQHAVGAVLPLGLDWRDFHTVEVEIGVSVGWPGLNDKAANWRQYPGVQYIVLIRLSPTLRVRQYRLEQRVNGQFPDTDDRMDIVDGAVLNADAHLLLALPDDAALPDGFRDPVTVDLVDIVEYARPKPAPLPNAPAPQHTP